MQPTDKTFPKRLLFTAILLLLLGIKMFLSAKRAEELHTVIPVYRWHSSMSPEQGYLVASVALAIGICLIVKCACTFRRAT